MHDRSFEPSRWYFLPPECSGPGLSRGLAFVTLLILTFFTLGLLVSAFVDAHAPDEAHPAIAAQVGTAP